jgi:hypothetical protein
VKTETKMDKKVKKYVKMAWAYYETTKVIPDQDDIFNFVAGEIEDETGYPADEPWLLKQLGMDGESDENDCEG